MKIMKSIKIKIGTALPLQRFREHCIELPFPQRDVDLKTIP
ncbi:MAG: hypothetical protein WAK96_03710 [Desulfobaccales bacterium]